MIPNFTLFGKTISVYMITALIGILLILYFTYRQARRKGLDEIHMLYMMLFAGLGAVIGGHMLYGVTNFPHIIHLVQNLSQISSWSDLLNRLILIFGGSVFYGGLIGGIFAAWLYARRSRLDIGRYADTAAPAIPLFHAIGRLGCFLSGCCYGVEWRHGFIYRFSAAPGANFVPRFPVQLVEGCLNLLLFFLLLYLLERGKLPGRLLQLYLLIYPVYRFVLEFFRGDDYRGFLFGLSTSQILSVVLFGISAVTWYMDAKRHPTKKHIGAVT